MIYMDKQSGYKHVLVTIMFFIHIYPLTFKAFPYASTRIAMAVIGILLYLLRLSLIKHNTERGIEYKAIYLALPLLVIFVLSFATVTINATEESYFLKYPLSIVALFSSSYTLYYVLHRMYGRVHFYLISKYIIISVTLQMIFTLFLSTIPELKEIILSLLTDIYTSSAQLNNIDYDRVIGIGSKHFSAGIVNSFALILISIGIKKKMEERESINYLLVSFLFIAIIGSIMSRTTNIGIGLSLLLIINNTKISQTIIFFIKSGAMIIIILIILSQSLSKGTINNLFYYTQYGFELIYSYFSYGSFESASTNSLLTDYDIIPKGNTWLIGDGYYALPGDSSKYYMDVDAGYLRLIYYFGLPGMFLFIISQYRLYRVAYKSIGQSYYQFIKYSFVLLLILNMKGFTDMTAYMSMFVFCAPYQSQESE